MIVNGIDLAGLEHQAPVPSYPEPVEGRVVHIDADFLAYEVSYEREPGTKSLDDMQHNATESIRHIRKSAGATQVHLHLTPGTSNKGGRSDIALLKEYQGSRKAKPKPAQLHVVRQWMAKAFPATLHQDCEADDGMSSAQYAAIKEGNRNLSVIASKDKDLNMVPGLHLNWDTGEITDAPNFGTLKVRVRDSGGKVVEGYGRKFFWAQMLMGDPTDGVSGLPAVIEMLGKPRLCGPMGALELLASCHNDKQCYDKVRGLYKRYGEEVGFTNWRDGTPVQWGRAFLSEAQLLWMRMEKHNPLCVTGYLKEVLAAK